MDHHRIAVAIHKEIQKSHPTGFSREAKHTNDMYVGGLRRALAIIKELAEAELDEMYEAEKKRKIIVDKLKGEG